MASRVEDGHRARARQVARVDRSAGEGASTGWCDLASASGCFTRSGRCGAVAGTLAYTPRSKHMTTSLLLAYSVAVLAVALAMVRVLSGGVVCPLCGARNRKHSEACPWRERAGE
jgi:hypothetical protein